MTQTGISSSDAAAVAEARERELARLNAVVDAAIDALEVASILAPDAALAVMFLGGVLARSSRSRDAEKALRRALELEDTPRIRNDLAAVLMRMHRHAEARGGRPRAAA